MPWGCAVTVLLALLRRIPAEVWAGLLLLGAITFAGWWVYDSGHDAGRADAAEEIAALKLQVAELEIANAAGLRAIHKLAIANNTLAEGLEVDRQAAAKAVADLRSENDALLKELDQRRKDRGVIYEQDQSAAAWGRARVPDAIAFSLRE